MREESSATRRACGRVMYRSRVPPADIDIPRELAPQRTITRNVDADECVVNGSRKKDGALGVDVALS